MPFTLPAAIALPIVTGFLLAGPVLGFLAAVLVAAAIVIVAIRMRAPESRRHAVRAERSAYDPGDRAVRRAAARRFAVPLVIAAAGIILIVAAEGAAWVIGWGVLAVAVTVAISLVFLEVGYSEDRARDREQRAGSPPSRRRRGGRALDSHRHTRHTPPGIRG
jgi:hypothetical protein